MIIIADDDLYEYRWTIYRFAIIMFFKRSLKYRYRICLISEFWPNLRILAKFEISAKSQNFSQFSQFWPNFRMLAKFQNFGQISELFQSVFFQSVFLRNVPDLRVF